MSNSIHNSPRVSPVSSAPEGASNDIAVTSGYGGRDGEGFSASEKRRIWLYKAMPEEGLEPPTRGL